MKKKKSVLIVHNFYQIPGGEDTVVANEKQLLEDNGHEVVLYTRHNSELNSLSKIQKLLLPITTIFNPRTYIEFIRIIRDKKVDVVHVHNTLNLISSSVYYAALYCKVPVVQTIHNFRLLCPGATFYRDGHICEECVEYGLTKAIKYSCYRNSKLQTMACVISTKFYRIMRIYEKLNYICLTDFNRDKLLQLKQIKPERVFVKPNFVKSKEEVVYYNDRENKFVFAGRLDKLKGIDILLEAWNQMGNNAPKLVICGTGPMEDWCKRYIAYNELTNVEMMGFVPNIEAREIITNSKALILPTQWYEGFPMTIVEAYAVGSPVICSDLGNAGSVVTEGVTGSKFKSDSAKELAQAVIRLADYKDIHNTTFAEYQAKYTEKQNYESLMMIYETASN